MAICWVRCTDCRCSSRTTSTARRCRPRLERQASRATARAREVGPIARPRSTPGPVARSVADVALLDAVITGGPRTLPRADRRGLRLGVARRSFFADLDPALEEVVDEALRQLQDSGVVL